MDLPFMMNRSDLVPGLVETKLGIAIPYIIILVIFAVVGTLGNILIIGSMTTGSNRTVVGNFFIVNLAMCDIVITLFINPMAIWGAVKGEKLFEANYWACKLLGNVCVIVCLAALLNIGAISINRYTFIVHNVRYSKIYTKWNTMLMCLVIWIIAYLVDMPAHIGWTDHAFDKKINKCLWDRPRNWYYTVFVIMVGIMVPLVITVCFYLLIFQHISAAKKRLASSGSGDKNSSFKSSLKQAKMMLIIFICFTACWLPYILVLLGDRYDTFPTWVHLYGSLTAHLHASINFIIYGISNRKIRAGYERFFYRYMICSRKRNVIDPQESVTDATVVAVISNNSNGYQTKKQMSLEQYT